MASSADLCHSPDASPLLILMEDAKVTPRRVVALPPAFAKKVQNVSPPLVHCIAPLATFRRVV